MCIARFSSAYAIPDSAAILDDRSIATSGPKTVRTVDARGVECEARLQDVQMARSGTGEHGRWCDDESHSGSEALD